MLDNENDIMRERHEGGRKREREVERREKMRRTRRESAA
jgi:hypothetical protein